MATTRKTQRIRLIVIGMVFLFASAGLVIFALGDGINLFRAPSQVVADQPKPDEVFRLGGMVKEGSLERGENSRISFVVTDTAEEIAVSYTGILPDLFREGQGVIMTGSLRDGRFEASEVLAKHDENYMPRELVDALKKQGVFKEGE